MSLGRQTPNANQGSRFGVFNRTHKRVAAKAPNDMISKHCGVLVKCMLLPLSIEAPHDKDLAIYGASSKIGPPPEHVRSTRPRVCGGIVALDAVGCLGFQGFRIERSGVLPSFECRWFGVYLGSGLRVRGSCYLSRVGSMAKSPPSSGNEAFFSTSTRSSSSICPALLSLPPMT